MLVQSGEAQMHNIEKATFGGGCFWCMEAVFEKVDGVTDVVSGYAGGEKNNPNYNEVCSGKTGHAEVIQITYNPEITTYNELLMIFWKSHDPTTSDRQGADIGSQYRSIVLTHNDEQKQFAEESLKRITKANLYPSPVVTRIEPLETFFIAENYHQDYFRNNPNAPYCVFVINPKLEKLEEILKN
ncbi:MAG: peptide-methionine (S)-S-oxide reductase MsrA [Candidatus Marinimicrobia bacterium]|nr:peptide-methionine (S)-S-oxide reductase MsrA [Candidatus Neomarinimicrobiota bacterium]